MSELAQGDCGVCIGGWDGDVENYYERIWTAKRNFVCYECGEIIKAGQEFEQAGGSYEGERKTYRFCLLCSEIGKAFSCDGRSFGDLWEHIEDELFPQLTTGCLEKLKTAKAKQHLLDKWNEWKFGGSV